MSQSKSFDQYVPCPIALAHSFLWEERCKIFSRFFEPTPAIKQFRRTGHINGFDGHHQIPSIPPEPKIIESKSVGSSILESEELINHQKNIRELYSKLRPITPCFTEDINSKSSFSESSNLKVFCKKLAFKPSQSLPLLDDKGHHVNATCDKKKNESVIISSWIFLWLCNKKVHDISHSAWFCVVDFSFQTLNEYLKSIAKEHGYIFSSLTLYDIEGHLISHLREINSGQHYLLFPSSQLYDPSFVPQELVRFIRKEKLEQN